jgi:hypothetical protein
MSRLVMSLCLSAVLALAGGPSSAQTSNIEKAQQKMKNAEEPTSPGKQQAAAKLADCKKQAKAQKLTGAKRRDFLKECAK